MPLKGLVLSDDERADRRRDSAKVEAEALRLYDKFNSEPDKVVRVSKAECIRRARRALLSRGEIK